MSNEQSVSKESARPLRIVIAGGGTGGHVLPAISVVEECRRRGERVEWLWIGSGDGVEADAARGAGIPFVAIPTGKLRRYLDLRTIRDAIRIPLGIFAAWKQVRRFRPAAILSTGGFVSVPTVVAGARIAPIVTHEQTTILGLATKINMRFADVLALSYERTRPAAAGFRKRTVVTGNPTRLSLRDGNAAAARRRFDLPDDLPLLYVTGGARGASPLNQRIEALLPELLEHCVIVHQTGPAGANDDAARLARIRSTWPAEIRRRYAITEFIRDGLPDLYAAADLAIARAGAGTVAEFALVGLPAIFIPLPLSGGSEQEVNAQTLAEAGAAVVIDQESARPELLRTEILGLLSDGDRRKRMAEAARSLARPEAAADLSEILLELARR